MNQDHVQGNQQAVSGAYGGGGGGIGAKRVTDEPQPISALETLAREQSHLISAFSGNIQELREIADKLFGPQPPPSQPAKDVKDANKRQGALYMLSDQVETLGHIQVALAHVCDRLRSLA